MCRKGALQLLQKYLKKFMMINDHHLDCILTQLATRNRHICMGSNVNGTFWPHSMVSPTTNEKKNSVPKITCTY